MLFLLLLSSRVEVISNQPSPFTNLRSLKIYPVNVHLEGGAQKKTLSDEIKNYLLDGCLIASFTLVTREEIKTRDATLAQHLIAELWAMLERYKADINWDLMKRPIEIYPEDLTARRELKEKIRNIISKLQSIESLLTKLPTLNRDKLQSSFSCLCAEANLVMKKIDHTYLHCSVMLES